MKHKLIAVLFALSMTTAANAQLDSVGVFRTARQFSDAHKKELTILFTASSIAFSGCVNANLYRPETAFLSVHTCQDLSTYSVLMAGYVSGLDPVESAGLGLVANFFFVGFINQAIFGTWINTQENCQYDSFGWHRRKLFCGQARYAEPVIGLILLNYRQIIRLFK